ncbi:putative Zn-dependent protease with MMP-like domain [Elusimicrobium posterum]|uniref:hypothetical protein n=1 Tax=Elusimicrobium posterum TaxID=3116653 RepID=UPI003C79098C
MKNIFKYSFFALALCAIFSQGAFAWAPFTRNHKDANPILKKIANGEPIRYGIYGEDKSGKSIPEINNDIEQSFQAWFSNVLSYKKDYKDFDKTFEDIIPALKKENKTYWVNMTNRTPALAKVDVLFEYKNERLTEAGIFSVVLGTYQTAKKSGCAAEYIELYMPKDWTFDKIKTSILTDLFGTTVHEIGHAFGLGDLYDEDPSTDFFHPRASGIKNSLMNGFQQRLTCDDADAIVSMIDMTNGTNRTFRSFCNDGSGYVLGRYTSNFDETIKKQDQLTRDYKEIQRQAIQELGTKGGKRGDI